MKMFHYLVSNLINKKSLTSKLKNKHYKLMKPQFLITLVILDQIKIQFHLQETTITVLMSGKLKLILFAVQN